MIELFSRRGRLLLSLLLFLQLSPEAVASEQLNIQQAETKVDTVGKIFLDKRTNEFYFLFSDNNHDMVFPVYVKTRKTFEQLKKLNKKWVRISGHKKWIKETFIELPRYLLKLEIEQLQEFRLAELKVFQINDQSKIAKIDYRVIDGDKPRGQTGIGISDEAVNDIIAGAGVIMGIAVGPMSLIPAGLLGLKTLFLDEQVPLH